jgi:hypothetical protein
MPRFRFVVMGALWLTAFFLFLIVSHVLAAPTIMGELQLTGVETGPSSASTIGATSLDSSAAVLLPINSQFALGQRSCFLLGVC